MINSNKVTQCVEFICQTGCDSVQATITSIEQGRVVPQIAGLEPEESAAVLRELKAVMAVYNEP